MRVNTRVLAHLAGEDRTFEAGEEVPEEWSGAIQNPAVIDPDSVVPVGEGEPVPEFPSFPEFAGIKTIQDVLGWVDAPEDPADRLVRAEFARATEGDAGRAGLLTGLDERLQDLRGQG